MLYKPLVLWYQHFIIQSSAKNNVCIYNNNILVNIFSLHYCHGCNISRGTVWNLCVMQHPIGLPMNINSINSIKFIWIINIEYHQKIAKFALLFCSCGQNKHHRRTFNSPQSSFLDSSAPLAFFSCSWSFPCSSSIRSYSRLTASACFRAASRSASKRRLSVREKQSLQYT